MAAAIYWRNPRLEAELEQVRADIGRDGAADPFVLLGTIDGPLNAEIARGVLEQEGLRVFLRPNTLGSVYGLTVGSFGAVRVYVLASQVEQAHVLLSQLSFGADAGADEEPARE